MSSFPGAGSCSFICKVHPVTLSSINVILTNSRQTLIINLARVYIVFTLSVFVKKQLATHGITSSGVSSQANSASTQKQPTGCSFSKEHSMGHSSIARLERMYEHMDSFHPEDAITALPDEIDSDANAVKRMTPDERREFVRRAERPWQISPRQGDVPNRK